MVGVFFHVAGGANSNGKIDLSQRYRVKTPAQTGNWV